MLLTIVIHSLELLWYLHKNFEADEWYQFMSFLCEMWYVFAWNTEVQVAYHSHPQPYASLLWRHLHQHQWLQNLKWRMWSMPFILCCRLLRVVLTLVASIRTGWSMWSGSHESQSACGDDARDARQVESVAVVLQNRNWLGEISFPKYELQGELMYQTELGRVCSTLSKKWEMGRASSSLQEFTSTIVLSLLHKPFQLITTTHLLICSGATVSKWSLMEIFQIDAT